MAKVLFVVRVPAKSGEDDENVNNSDDGEREEKGDEAEAKEVKDEKENVNNNSSASNTSGETGNKIQNSDKVLNGDKVPDGDRVPDGDKVPDGDRVQDDDKEQPPGESGVDKSEDWDFEDGDQDGNEKGGSREKKGAEDADGMETTSIADSVTLKSIDVVIPPDKKKTTDSTSPEKKDETKAVKIIEDKNGDETDQKKTINGTACPTEEDAINTQDSTESAKGQNGMKTEGDEKQKEKESQDTENAVDGSENDTGLIRLVSEDYTLIERVKLTLEDHNVTGVQWTLTEDKVYVGMFVEGDGERCEEIWNALSKYQLGVISGSSISVFPASIGVAGGVEDIEEKEQNSLAQELEKEDKLAEKVKEFKKSIKSRLVVAQVVESVKSDAMFTFDYLMLLILASLVAVMGLIESSSVVLVASMLISPLMGPILAGVFGAVIKNYELLRLGIRSEMMGLGLCILVGFVTGFIPAALESGGLAWRSVESWPNVEMSSRGSRRSLPVGVLIALPSGAGVALSILGGKVGSLVGVAISASLLPPAVNAGLLWANAIVVKISPPAVVRSRSFIITSTTPSTSSVNLTQVNITTPSSSGAYGTLYDPDIDCPSFLNNEYIPQYYCDMAKECAVLGAISLTLTILNIICIIFMGILVLKIKEVAPIKSVPSAEKDFFAKDLKIARDSYQTAKGQGSLLMGKKFLEEYKRVKNDAGVVDEEGETDLELNFIMRDVEEQHNVQAIVAGLPHKPPRWSWALDDIAVERAYRTFHAGGIKSPGTDEEIRFRPHRGSFTESPGVRKKNRPDSYTVHTFIPPEERSRRDSSPSPRSSGKSLAKLIMPKTSRFQIKKVMEAGKVAPTQIPDDNTAVQMLPAIKEHEPLLSVATTEM